MFEVQYLENLHNEQSLHVMLFNHQCILGLDIILISFNDCAIIHIDLEIDVNNASPRFFVLMTNMSPAVYLHRNIAVVRVAILANGYSVNPGGGVHVPQGL